MELLERGAADITATISGKMASVPLALVLIKQKGGGNGILQDQETRSLSSSRRRHGDDVMIQDM